jgi:hypothetical protein
MSVHLGNPGLDEMRQSKPFTVDDAISDLPEAMVPSGSVLPYPETGNPTVITYPFVCSA